MKIKINNFNKAELLERKRIIEELLNIKETEMELNEEPVPCGKGDPEGQEDKSVSSFYHQYITARCIH